MQVLMVAAENDALPNAKVGGVADVVRDIPKALAELGHDIAVVIPDYGMQGLEKKHLAHLHVPFAGRIEEVELCQVMSADHKVKQYLLSHWQFSCHQGALYCNDVGRPFATDASKFALFNAAVCEALLQNVLATPDVLHLHDWHSACVAVLLKNSPRLKAFNSLKLIYTVHNLALQGIRPFKGDESSFESWFPELGYNGQQLCDPRYPDCFNPMRSAINLVDKVHLVSPSYCDEVQQPSHPENGFFGGEGLEQDLIKAQQQGKLVGILNGCEYPESTQQPASLAELYQQVEQALLIWMSKSTQLESSHYIANQRLKQFIDKPFKGPIVTSVGRLTDQKVLLLRQPFAQHQVIDEICAKLQTFNGCLIMLGSGDTECEQQMTQAMARNSNFLFLKGYAQLVGDSLYQCGDLFLMPSSFEPCGISQMLAMRAGQPCIVHGVGGLKDTVKHNESGFVFSGETMQAQIDNLLTTLDSALSMFRDDNDHWRLICEQAKQQRFSWQDTAQAYLAKLYY